MLKGNAEDYRRSEARKEILRLLEKEGEPLSPREIAEALEKKDTAVRQLLRSMVQDGEVTRHGTSSQSRYSLPGGHNDGHGTHGHHDDHGSDSVVESQADVVFDLEADLKAAGLS